MLTNVQNTEAGNELAKAGVVYGHKKSKTHPRMRPYIGGMRQEIELLDPDAVLKSLEKAAAFLKETIKNGGTVLFVGTSPAAKDIIEAYAKKHNFPYVITRWLGGTLTNHKVIMGRIKYYLELKEKKETGALTKYTKKEQVQFQKEIGKLSKSFVGLVQYTKLPNALFVVDAEQEKTAIREALQFKIPVVAVLDTNDNPDVVEYPIFANDHSRMSIEWVLGEIEKGTKDVEK